ncbi:MAG: hypothetical protein IJ465_06060 [Clostridia bacterium]|nr:hypothetical protein [Clostridia bacterium]
MFKRMAALLLALLFLCSCQTPTVSPDELPSGTTTTTRPNTQGVDLTDNTFFVRPDTVRFIGRHHLDVRSVTYGFYNVAAGFVFDCESTSLELYMSASMYSEHQYNYVAVYIDDREPIAVCVDRAAWYTVATDLEPGVRHTVRVVKRSMSNAGAVYIGKVRLSDDSRAWPNTDVRPYRIQVLGDSISCGYGSLWDGSETEEITVWQGGDKTFAVRLANRLNAELEIVAIGGIGVGNVENAPYPLLPNYKQEDMYNGVDCDFSLYVPDVIVIELGANDYGNRNPPEVFRNNAMTLIDFIREQYPDTTIVWVYGMMGGVTYGNNIKQLVEYYRQNGDAKIHYMPFALDANEPWGQHGHPGQQTHDRLGDELAATISEIMDWPLLPAE